MLTIRDGLEAGFMPRKRKTEDRRPPFAEWLVGARQSHGLTQTALAERAEISSAHVSKMEAGVSNPSREMVGRLARAMLPAEADPRTVEALANEGLDRAGFKAGEVHGFQFDPEKGFVIGELPEEFRDVQLPDRPEDMPPELLAAMHYSQKLDPDAQRIVYGLWLLQAKAHAYVRLDRQREQQEAARVRREREQEEEKLRAIRARIADLERHLEGSGE